MFEGLDTALAVLLITWGAPLAGLIPVLIGWDRIKSAMNSTGEPASSRALRFLTASICIAPIGFTTLRVIALFAEPLGVVQIFSIWTWIGVLAAAFALNLAALITVVRERNAARTAVLVGSLVVGLVNTAGWIWLYNTSGFHS